MFILCKNVMFWLQLCDCSDCSHATTKALPQESGGFVQFGLDLIDVFESVSNIRAFMQQMAGEGQDGSLELNGTRLSCT
jgi:hypothetical protein